MKRIMVASILLAGCGSQVGAREISQYVQATQRIVRGDAKTIVGYDVVVTSDDVSIYPKNEYGLRIGRVVMNDDWPRSVLVDLASTAVETIISEESIVINHGTEQVGVYHSQEELDDPALEQFRERFTVAGQILADEYIVAVVQDAKQKLRVQNADVISVGTYVGQDAMITNGEAYWCGVGAAGAIIIGGPASGFLYAIACGMWADMDSW